MKNLISNCFLIALICSIALLYSVDVRSEKTAKADDKKGPPPATGVIVEKVIKDAILETISIVGSVDSPRVSRIGSEVEGIVKEIFIEEGDFVNKGKPLLQLSNSQLKINIMEAEAEEEEARQILLELNAGSRSQEIEAAKALMDESEALWKIAKNNFERYNQLFHDKVIDESLVTNSKLEAVAAESAFYQKKFAYELSLEGTRKEEIGIAEASVKVKKARVTLLKDRLEKTTIDAPFNGVIVDKIIEIGEWVNVGHQVFKISQVDPIRVTLPVPESIVGQISIGTKVDIRVEAFPGRNFSGKVYRIIPEALKGSRTFPVILVLNNRKKLLKIGMMVRGILPYGKKREVLFVPQDAITISRGKNVVYLIDKNKLAKMVPVKIGTMKKGRIEVKGDLVAGDLVVTRGGERLRPGMPLKIIAQ